MPEVMRQKDSGLLPPYHVVMEVFLHSGFWKGAPGSNILRGLKVPERWQLQTPSSWCPKTRPAGVSRACWLEFSPGADSALPAALQTSSLFARTGPSEQPLHNGWLNPQVHVL